jgi:signal transduction histidine kinase
MRELALHILDLVQNAIEAQASRVELCIDEDCAKDVLTIRVLDNGRGMSAEMVKTALDPFVTTRLTRRIGLGLALLDMSTSRSGGYMEIESEPGRGTKIKASYQYSHFDRPPLGNMAATIQTLITLNPQLDFSYHHTVMKRAFSVETRELAAAIGDIPFTQPEIIEWLKEYLAAGIANLYGGEQFENC